MDRGGQLVEPQRRHFEERMLGISEGGVGVAEEIVVIHTHDLLYSFAKGR
jgi:hypothetical protein